MTPPEDKLRTIDELAEECARWREDGLQVVLVNGAFDLLHRSKPRVQQLSRFESAMLALQLLLAD